MKINAMWSLVPWNPLNFRDELNESSLVWFSLPKFIGSVECNKDTENYFTFDICQLAYGTIFQIDVVVYALTDTIKEATEHPDFDNHQFALTWHPLGRHFPVSMTFIKS